MLTPVHTTFIDGFLYNGNTSGVAHAHHVITNYDKSGPKSQREVLPFGHRRARIYIPELLGTFRCYYRPLPKTPRLHGTLGWEKRLLNDIQPLLGSSLLYSPRSQLPLTSGSCRANRKLPSGALKKATVHKLYLVTYV